ncbi:MAG: orotidine-5'-phosphate decarboxylase [Desulforegulaceae bacterium]|nr:orotidine-5'-phosphate decarboxylase [Desulforegulaceae bacterium]
MDPKNKIIFALDFSSFEEARLFIDLLKNKIGVFKVGLELFIKEGQKILDYINQNTGNEIFLDLKLLDIPKTVERSVAIVKDFNVRFLTVHAQDRKTLEAAVKGSGGKVDILGVTVLTSLGKQDLKEQGIAEPYLNNSRELVEKRAKFAFDSGIKGVICSPLEASLIKNKFGPDFFAVTPGIRMAHNVNDDQSRTATPFEAIKNGADYIVVGRPIKNAQNPEKEAEQIAFEIERGLKEKV